MTKILFVCLGNICRSPMAEFVMKDLVQKAGLSEQFLIESAGTYAAGGAVYPPAKKKLGEHGISCKGKFSRQLIEADYGNFDLLIGMDNMNRVTMQHIFGGDPEDKIHLLLDYTGHPRDIEDPWYTRNFETAWQDIVEGCQGLLELLELKVRQGFHVVDK